MGLVPPNHQSGLMKVTQSHRGIKALPLKLCWPAWPSKIISTVQNHNNIPQDKANGYFYLLLQEYKLWAGCLMARFSRTHPKEAGQHPVCVRDAEWLPPPLQSSAGQCLCWGLCAGSCGRILSTMKFNDCRQKVTTEITCGMVLRLAQRGICSLNWSPNEILQIPSTSNCAKAKAEPHTFLPQSPRNLSHNTKGTAPRASGKIVLTNGQ